MVLFAVSISGPSSKNNILKSVVFTDCFVKVLLVLHDCNVILYRLSRAVCSIRPHTEPVMAMDLSPDGQHVLSAGGGNVLARSSLTSSSHTSNTSALDTSLRSALKERPSGPTTWTSPTESIPEISACMEDTASSQSLVYYDASELPVSGTYIIQQRAFSDI